MKYYPFGKLILLGMVMFLCFSSDNLAQEQAKGENNKSQRNQSVSIGGKEHESNIYGVEIGMDVPTALRAVFENAKREAGQEKPDAFKKEGESKQDIRVVYKDLPKGEMQIVFADGKYVKEIVLMYKLERNVDDLRLPFSATIGSSTSTIYNTSATQSGVEAPAVLDGSTDIVTFGKTKSKDIEKYSAKTTGNIDRSRGDLLDGTRYDDRYTIGFTDRQKLQRTWWRDEKKESGYSVRVYFVAKKLTEAGARFVPSIVQKSVVVKPGDEEKLRAKLIR